MKNQATTSRLSALPASQLEVVAANEARQAEAAAAEAELMFVEPYGDAIGFRFVNLLLRTFLNGGTTSGI